MDFLVSGGWHEREVSEQPPRKVAQTVHVHWRILPGDACSARAVATVSWACELMT